MNRLVWGCLADRAGGRGVGVRVELRRHLEHEHAGRDGDQGRRQGDGADGHRAGLPRPAGGIHDPVGRGDVDLLPRPVHLRAQERPARRRGDPRAGAELPEGLLRRQDVHADAAHGPEVQRRHARSRRATSRTRSSARSSSTGAASRSSPATSRAPPPTTPARPRRSPASRPTTRRGKITITLTKPYGAFLNVLAFPSAGLVPSGTKMTNLSNDPPPGVGPYAIKDVVPNRSFDVVRNPDWRTPIVPGVPPGHVDRERKDRFEHADRGRAGAQQLGRRLRLGGPDPAVAGARRSRSRPATATSSRTRSRRSTSSSTPTPSRSTTSSRARRSTTRSTGARSNRLNGGNFTQTCWFLPEGLVGHPTGPCPYGDPNGAPDIAKAKQLVQQSGHGRPAGHGVE